MTKIKFKSMFSLLILAGMLGTASVAHGADLTWSADYTVDLSSPSISLMILSGSEATSLTVHTGSIAVVVANGDTFRVTSDERELVISGETTSVVSSVCAGSTSTATITGGSAGETITITPATTDCDGSPVSSSGGSSHKSSSGSGGQPAPIPAPVVLPVPLPPIIYYNFGTTVLKNGSRGEAVKELQRFLNAFLHLGLDVDGILGPKTIAVIKTWQLQNGLVPDGLVGPLTKAKMYAIAAAGTTATLPSLSPVPVQIQTTYAFGTTTVILGSTGEACKAWQQFFNDKTGAALSVDGFCGPLTIAAAKKWQASVGLPSQGILGPLSRAKALATP